MSDQYIGEIRMFAGNYAPEGWAFCNGQLLQINGNEALFSLIGVTYGGDGQTTFALPDLQGRIPVGMKNSAYSLGQKAGSETVTLTVAGLPVHTHQVNAQSGDGTATSPQNNVWASSSINEYSSTAPNGAMLNTAIQETGGNQSHDNMMPFFTVSFIIALQGVYPDLQ